MINNFMGLGATRAQLVAATGSSATFNARLSPDSGRFRKMRVSLCSRLLPAGVMSAADLLSSSGTDVCLPAVPERLLAPRRRMPSRCLFPVPALAEPNMLHSESIGEARESATAVTIAGNCPDGSTPDSRGGEITLQRVSTGLRRKLRGFSGRYRLALPALTYEKSSS